MEIWLQQQASSVVTALSHAQELYRGPTPPAPPRPFALPADLEADLGSGLV